MVEISKRTTQLVRALPGILATILCVLLLTTIIGIPYLVRAQHTIPVVVNIKEVPDVVIEQESFRRFGLLNPEVCTYCGESWRVCTCKMGKDPLMFQNREQQTAEKLKTELLKYNVKLDKQ